MYSTSIEALKLPSDFDEAVNEAEESLASFLSQPDQPDDRLHALLESIREASFRFLERRRGQPFFYDISPPPLSLLTRILRGDVLPFRGPIFGRRSLVYLPQNANSMEYGTPSSLFPDTQRYAHEWTSPSDRANTASRMNGNLSCYVRVNNNDVRQSDFAEAGIGFYYNPPNRLSTIEVRPEVGWSGAFRSLIDVDGSVEIFVQLRIGLWQVIPPGRSVTLLRSELFSLGTSGRRDRTMNNPRPTEPWQQIPNQKPSALFQVEGSRTYLITVASQLRLQSSLFISNNLGIPSQEKLSVYAQTAATVSSIRVTRTQINLF
jgi:hypothetical protein